MRKSVKRAMKFHSKWNWVTFSHNVSWKWREKSTHSSFFSHMQVYIECVLFCFSLSLSLSLYFFFSFGQWLTRSLRRKAGENEGWKLSRFQSIWVLSLSRSPSAIHCLIPHHALWIGVLGFLFLFLLFLLLFLPLFYIFALFFNNNNISSFLPYSSFWQLATSRRPRLNGEWCSRYTSININSSSSSRMQKCRWSDTLTTTTVTAHQFHYSSSSSSILLSALLIVASIFLTAGATARFRECECSLHSPFQSVWVNMHSFNSVTSSFACKITATVTPVVVLVCFFFFFFFSSSCTFFFLHLEIM